MTDQNSNAYATLLTMAIDQGKQLERVLQMQENLEERQDDMKQGMDYLLKMVNGNGDGRGGLKTAAALHDDQLSQLKKEIDAMKAQQALDHEWMSLARQFFADRKQIQFGWKQFLTMGLIQTVVTTVVLTMVARFVPAMFGGH